MSSAAACWVSTCRASATPRLRPARARPASATGSNFATPRRLAERAALEAAIGSKRYAEGLDHLRLTRQLAAAGVIGEFGCTAQKLADRLVG